MQGGACKRDADYRQLSSTTLISPPPPEHQHDPKADSRGRPAAGKHSRLPFYDLIAKLLGADSARGVLAEQTEVQPGQRVLEIGCGTGSLLVLLKQRQPGAEVVGLDPDAAALAIAGRKARPAGLCGMVYYAAVSPSPDLR